jgi:glutathione S-transferase
MKLYVTATSPYARIARAVVLEKRLADSVEVIHAITRKVDSPYYKINPSGRVPYLERDDGVGIEDSRLIASYLDSLDGNPSIVAPFDLENWESGRLETYARSMVDGISVWVREMRRPETERSPTMQAHEASRAGRLADFWEDEITAPLMNGPLNLSQLLLISGLDFAAYGRMGDFTEGRPKLAKWAVQMRHRPSIAATGPVSATKPLAS